MQIDGGCHCGAITYTAEVDPDEVMICHCTDCQKIGGSAFRVVVRTPESRFRLTAGTPKIYVKTADSGNGREQAFCPDCGTHIYATSVGGDDRQFGLRVGTIRQRDLLPPRAQYWTRSAQGWLGQIAKLPAVDKQ